MTAAACSWGGNCPRPAVASIGWIIPGDPKVYALRPMCAEDLAYYTSPGCVDAYHQHAASTGAAPHLAVIDYRVPQACAACGHADNAHRAGDCDHGLCPCAAFVPAADDTAAVTA